MPILANEITSDMDMPRTERNVEQRYLQKSMTYEAYKQLVEDLLAAGKATGPQQSEGLVHYSQLNLQRMHRVEKTIQILPEVKEQLLRVSRPQIWLVLTEGWCGDAAQSLPVMKALADLNPNIQLRTLLRDENPELMDRYLTNGISRSIPRLIAVDPATGAELFNWGPRPAGLQETFYGMRSEGLPYEVIKEELQRWYNTDKTVTIQRELAALATETSQG
jgi:UDP:flavonoid glycosyltransferase YjiC (YdhE family)